MQSESPYRELGTVTPPRPLACPKCRRISPGGTQRCDCGFAFFMGGAHHPRVDSPADQRAIRRKAREQQITRMWTGIGLATLGAILTAPALAVGKGTTWFGAVIIGVGLALRGYLGARKLRD